MVKKNKEEKTSVLDTIKAIREKYGDESIMSMDEQPKINIDRIPTGSFGLDLALGIGGLPRGRITEIFGPESSGKTTLALHVIAESHKANKDSQCAFIDVEHAMDPDYAKKLGVDLSRLFISQPDNGEQALDILESIIKSNKFDVVIVDSVAALVPKDEMEGEMGQQFMGKQARLMGQAMRKIQTIKSRTVIIFINQIRMMLNVFPGQSPETTPGGKALRYAATIRLDIRRIAQIKKGDEIVGGRTRIKVIKNKVAVPFKQTEFDILYGEGISFEGELLALGSKYNILTKSTGGYVYGDIKLGRGYDASKTYLKNNTMTAKIIENEIREKILVEKPISDTDSGVITE